MLQGQKGVEEHASQVILSNWAAHNVNEAGRQAQAIVLLDEVIRFTAVAADTSKVCLSRHADLDGRIRSFLALLFDQTGAKNTSRVTGSIALCIR